MAPCFISAPAFTLAPCFPDAARQVSIPPDFKMLLIALCFSITHHPAVKAQAASFRQIAHKKLIYCRYIRFSFFHKVNAASPKLVRRLQKIPSVGPKSCPVSGHKQCPRRTGEPGHKLPAFKIFVYILGPVKIRSRYQIYINALRLHFAAKRRKLLSHKSCLRFVYLIFIYYPF